MTNNAQNLIETTLKTLYFIDVIRKSRQKGEKNEVAAVMQGHASVPVDVSKKSKTTGESKIWCASESNLSNYLNSLVCHLSISLINYR